MKEKALLVTVKLEYDKATEDVLERERELVELASAAGAVVAVSDLCNRDKTTADLYIGKGKAEELAIAVKAKNINCVIFNNDLTGTQHRNLEKMLEAKVIDRTQLILDIFARRAKSPEGKAQVELAQLQYLLPRLSGKGAELSRLGGGIGTRGPGEQKLEQDRRRVREKIIRVKKGLKDIEDRRNIMRERRDEFSLPTVVFVGYTSAGKSTLFNALSGSFQLVSKGLFTTLDPLLRAIVLSNHQKVVISDTVGFIRDLPHRIIEAFKATLEEVTQADLLVHVLDISSPKAQDHFNSVRQVLGELGALDKKAILVLNKIDQIGPDGQFERAMRDYPDGVPISALKHQNLDKLLKKMEESLSTFSCDVILLVPLEKMELVRLIYREGKVRDIRYGQDSVRIEATLPVASADKLRKFIII
ncbi:MAG: GTPase HflX [Candidatus Omnitrophica bacterium CG_4_10_14_0_2_um_filter_44_9]|nr:MAG: GTPase HflX [Candidatus Omnitrophica bacterium CG_4_10_14_0_8_um_filter_44_12]PIZ84304.1 MAG: GTPase HflX [Candidatus Omnitrophica bacterium CG_4_10_14_0_2_um_filter_44_9]